MGLEYGNDGVCGWAAKMAILPERITMSEVRLTEYSHGAGCGCKIAPDVLDDILAGTLDLPSFPDLLVGHASRDDAAVHRLSDGRAVVSTTDFFMPIVDDPFTFGRIAATNAMSDIYAMGGQPLMAIAILAWPVSKLPARVAAQVVDGGRRACMDAGIPLAGGHSIDAPEPIFGLAVTGLVKENQLKRNDTARAGDRLYLTKPLGVGILSTAQKQKKLEPADAGLAPEWMCRLNAVGVKLATVDGVHAMTDVTGFGLLGHLNEMCTGSGLVAELEAQSVPLLPRVHHYLALGCVPGGSRRNLQAYGTGVSGLEGEWSALLSDPQTSGGLLLAVDETARAEVEGILADAGLPHGVIGRLRQPEDGESVRIHVR